MAILIEPWLMTPRPLQATRAFTRATTPASPRDQERGQNLTRSDRRASASLW